MKYAIIIVLVLGALTFAMMNYHFILLDDSLKVLKKTEWTLDSTFVDARGTKKIKLLLNPALAKAGFRDLLKKEGISLEK
ncbi:MAG: hypothetical protein ACOC23_07135 [Thermodesulfobacteriota bacterium]